MKTPAIYHKHESSVNISLPDGLRVSHDGTGRALNFETRSDPIELRRQLRVLAQSLLAVVEGA